MAQVLIYLLSREQSLDKKPKKTNKKSPKEYMRLWDYETMRLWDHETMRPMKIGEMVRWLDSEIVR